MSKLILREILAICWLLMALIAPSIVQAGTCAGRFPNPITDYCWECALPLTISKAKILALAQEDIDNPANPTCFCAGVPPTVGVTIGFWEPARQVDVTRVPYCMVSLGGLDFDPGLDQVHGEITNRNEGYMRGSFYQAHYYTNPVLTYLEVLNDFPCLEKGTLDIAYMTELDPTWSDDELSAVFNPEVLLFANPVAIAACTIDCITATAGFPLPQLFWCGGCQGPLYPLDGVVGSHVSPIQASLLISQRMLAKMHKQLIAWGFSGDKAMCGPYFQPIMDKTNYKSQMTYPIPNTNMILGRCCQPLGRSEILWGSGKTFPIKGEDFSYLIFRKRNCCAAPYKQ